MIGPPGSGKSMLAARLPGLMPMLDGEAAKASAAVLSLVGQFRPEAFGVRPYRQPHHTASAVALVGGGNPPRPGEISLAHQGVLFLDELPEFDRKVLESLREPLESGQIHIARAARHARFPAEFQLVAAMNPCPCGFSGHSNGKCRCTPDQIARYRGKLSGPFLDRIDLLIEVPAVPVDALGGTGDGESSATVRSRVEAALARQRERQGKANARLTAKEVDTLCQPDEAGTRLLRQASVQLDLSARAWHRIQGRPDHRRSRGQRLYSCPACGRGDPVPAPVRCLSRGVPPAPLPFCWPAWRRSVRSRSTPTCPRFTTSVRA
jgi:magnesium chelatase family protein